MHPTEVQGTQACCMQRKQSAGTVGSHLQHDQDSCTVLDALDTTLCVTLCSFHLALETHWRPFIGMRDRVTQSCKHRGITTDVVAYFWRQAN